MFLVNFQNINSPQSINMFFRLDLYFFMYDNKKLLKFLVATNYFIYNLKELTLT